ncbi:hypothetical protein VFPPC_14667 [Pochonia chlamydosporia 170]|uniref:Uncharacterized protein n=1 Tax=Pochonia chlamydosporia 170 TaxID=1380566 RepID=A0A179FD47_METCM|nr:hypothetical protein VFPPC_14667 [Pochonia chlamydosporia 170]OAQ63495.1 hypothetical protein VFPPC_14667 [Pochonia chlamydosporia 170]
MPTFKSLAILCLLPLQALVAQAIEAPLPNYTVEDIIWDIEVFPGQERQNFTGTIQEVTRQVLAINPQWELPVANKSAPRTDMETLEKRVWTDWKTLNCGGGPYKWATANSDVIREGIEYLRGLSEDPRQRPQNRPGGCGRVSCSYNSAIWWCNDNKVLWTLDYWTDIGDGAFFINFRCANDQTRRVVGQAFTSVNWNVIVRGDKC